MSMYLTDFECNYQ